MEGENEDLLRTINEFLKFEKGYDIKELHCLIGKDLDFAQLDLQYKELSKSSEEINNNNNNNNLGQTGCFYLKRNFK